MKGMNLNPGCKTIVWTSNQRLFITAAKYFHTRRKHFIIFKWPTTMKQSKQASDKLKKKQFPSFFCQDHRYSNKQNVNSTRHFEHKQHKVLINGTPPKKFHNVFLNFTSVMLPCNFAVVQDSILTSTRPYHGYINHLRGCKIILLLKQQTNVQHLSWVLKKKKKFLLLLWSIKISFWPQRKRMPR